MFVKGSPNDSVVDVDGEKVPLHTYWSHYYRSVDPNKPLDQAAQAQKRDETIRDLVQSIVFKRVVTDALRYFRFPTVAGSGQPYANSSLSNQGTI